MSAAADFTAPFLQAFADVKAKPQRTGSPAQAAGSSCPTAPFCITTRLQRDASPLVVGMGTPQEGTGEGTMLGMSLLCSSMQGMRPHGSCCSPARLGSVADSDHFSITFLFSGCSFQVPSPAKRGGLWPFESVEICIFREKAGNQSRKVLTTRPELRPENGKSRLMKMASTEQRGRKFVPLCLPFPVVLMGDAKPRTQSCRHK